MRYRNQRGSVLLLLVITIPFLFALSAIAVDIGALYLQRAHMQNIADATALAGAQELPNRISATDKVLEYIKINKKPNSILENDYPVFSENDSRIDVKLTQHASSLFLGMFNFPPPDITVIAAAKISKGGKSYSIFSYEGDITLNSFSSSPAEGYHGNIHSNGKIAWSLGQNTLIDGTATARAHEFKDNIGNSKYADLPIQTVPITAEADYLTMPSLDLPQLDGTRPDIIIIDRTGKGTLAINHWDETQRYLGKNIYVKGAGVTIQTDSRSIGTVIADGNIEMNGSSVLNSIDGIALYSFNGDISLNWGSAIFNGTIYAKNGNIKVTAGSMKIYGSVVARKSIFLATEVNPSHAPATGGSTNIRLIL